MSVFKKNGNWWIDCYINGQRVRRKVGPDKRTAELAEKNLKVRAAKGEWLGIQHIKRINFKAFIKEFMSKQAGKAPGTVESYRRTCELHLVPFFGDRNLTNIRRKHVEDYVQFRAQTASPGTVNKELKHLQTALNAAKRWDYLQESPARGVKLLKIPEKEPPYLNREQVAKLYDACTGWRYTFVAIALNTGLRVSEILALSWEDIDFHSEVIEVRSGATFTTKTGRNREIPINRFLYQVLRKAPRHIQNPHIIFTSQGTSPTRKQAHSRFKYILKRAGVPTHFRVHDLRHTFGTTLAANGVDLRSIQELMGHSDIKTTMQYLHAVPNRMKGAVETLGLDGAKETDKRSEMQPGGQDLDTGDQRGKIVSL